MEPLSGAVDRLASLGASLNLDPASWVALHQHVPVAVAGVLVGGGLLACFFGSGRIAFRLVLAPLAAVLGWLAGPRLAEQTSLGPDLARYAGAGALGAIALLFPPALLFVAAGLGGGLLGGELVGAEDYWAGAVPGFFIGGALAIGLQRFLAVLVSSLVGAASFTLGALSLLALSRFAGLANRLPIGVVVFAGLLAVGSMAYQFRFTPTDEERAQRRAERMRIRELAADAKRRDKRLKAYGKQP